jgi:DNA-binding CsgD family transcriptional regulator
MLFAVREAADRPPWVSQLPELAIGRLGDGAATNLLRDVTGGRLNPDVEARLLRESGGNPLALVEMARQLTPEQLAGTVDVPDPLPPGGSVQQLFARRISQLGPGARRLLAVAAAEPTVSERVAWAVAERLGVDADSVEAELDRFVRFGDVVKFSHPLVRSLAYYGIPASERRTVHRALAREVDAGEAADRAAWHLAMAATGPDEAVASQLEQAAQRARHRGGYAATATLLQRAATLTADEHRRADRLLAASEAALTAARPDQARALLDEVRRLETTERQAAIAPRLSGEAFFATAATDDAARELLAAAKALMPFHPTLARRTLLTSLIAAVWAPSAALDEVCTFAATISEAHLPVDAVRSAPDLFLFGFLHRQAGDAEPAAQLLRKALTELGHPDTSDDMRVAIPPIVPSIAGVELLDENVAFDTAISYADFARQAGALTMLPLALVALGRVYVRQGRFEDAEVALTEVTQLVRATGAPGSPDISGELKLHLLCWRGDEAGALAVADALAASAGRPEPGFDLASADLAVLELSKGRYQQAFERLEPITRQDHLGFGTLMLADFIEAAARCGERAAAMFALDRLAARATAGAARLGLGRLARSRALVEVDDTEEQYRESITLIRGANSVTELARSHLAFGEWLRRQRRRREARTELMAAYELFADMGAAAFAERARIELEATGAKARKRVVDTATDLTPQEGQVARLVANGDTNREAAAKLFLSPATVEYHLRKVYQKLGVSSRTQLVRKMALDR